MDSISNEIGFQSLTNTTSTIYNRNYFIDLACQYGHRACVDTARAEFDKFKAGNYS